MGGSPKVPKPSAEERELQKQQAETLKLQREILEQQRQQATVLIPFMADQQGFDVETDEFGNITKISKRNSEQEQLQKELELGLTKRSLAALKGELPVSPGLEREIGRQEDTLRERLGQQLGPGYETSTAGIQTMGDFFQNSEILREGARTQQLTLAEQLGIARQQQNDFKKLSSQDYLRQVAVGDPLTMAGAFGQNAAGFGKAQEPYIQQRQMQLQASIAGAQNKASMFGAGIGLIGSLFSDERLKSDAIRISTLEPLGLPIYEYTMDGERRIGVFASDVQAVMPHAVGERLGYNVVNYEALNADAVEL